MKRYLMSCVGGCVSIAMLSPMIGHAQCPVKIGSLVTLGDVELAYSRLEQSTPIKGEYETTVEFEARKTTSGGKANETLLLRSVWDPKRVKYDADNQRFVASSFAWSNLGIGWRNALKNGEPYGISGVQSLKQHGIVLKKDIVEGDSYEASNAYGATTRVVAITDTTYAVYDRKKKDMFDENWSTDFVVSKAKGKDGNVDISGPAVGIPVPIDEAKQINGKLQVGIYFKLKGPKILKGSGSFSATMAAPYDKDFQYRIFVGDILCAVITDPDGKVLKTVLPSY
ncbi:MAG: hypothetical protein COA69_03095 [Robiginitomaculum sp.]|nr:MAG: hypothetical protein COA69_03095 [Robiginitomaculum sp.]